MGCFHVVRYTSHPAPTECLKLRILQGFIISSPKVKFLETKNGVRSGGISFCGYKLRCFFWVKNKLFPQREYAHICIGVSWKEAYSDDLLLPLEMACLKPATLAWGSVAT